MKKISMLFVILSLVLFSLACQALTGERGENPTRLSVDEVMDFYRDVFGEQGYTEREILTVVSDTTFRMVFDRHESGKAIVVQGVDLGDGTVNVNICL